MNFSWISDDVSAALKIGGGKWTTRVAQRLRLAPGQVSSQFQAQDEKKDKKQRKERSSGYIPNSIFFHHIKHSLYTSNFFFSSSPISWLGNIHKLPLLTTHYIKIPKSVMTFNNKISDEGILQSRLSSFQLAVHNNDHLSSSCHLTNIVSSYIFQWEKS